MIGHGTCQEPGNLGIRLFYDFYLEGLISGSVPLHWLLQLLKPRLPFFCVTLRT